MHPFGELSVQRRRLGEALRVARANARLSGEQLAKRLGISQSRVSRIELGQQAASAELVRHWTEVTGAPQERCAELVGWVEAAGTEAVVWRTAKTRDMARLPQDTGDVHAGAATILCFQPVLVPGLLQVPEYARRIVAAGHPSHRPAEIAAAVAGRMDRQLVLYEGTTRLEFVITECALRWWVGPPHVMLAQLDRITALAGLESVQVQVIPLDTQIDAWHEHAFVVLDDRVEADAMVHLETRTNEVTTTDPAEVAFYRDAFLQLQEAAVHALEADALFHRLREGLLRTQPERRPDAPYPC